MSVKAADEKTQSLQRKLRAGKDLVTAASESGMELADAEQWLVDQRRLREFDADTLAMVATKSLRIGVGKLVALAQGEMRIKSEGGGISATAYESTDLLAARELVRVGIELRKLLGPAGNASAGGPEDLFDRAPSEGGNWAFASKDG